MELAHQHGHYEPLPSLPEGDGGPACPDLVGGENVEWAAISNLDAFFVRLYRYWLEKGWLVILTSRLLNLAALAFTICFSAFLLLGVDWGALHAKCLMVHSPGSCDILTVAVHAHPLHGRSPALVALAGTYVALCCLYWAWSAAAALGELRGVFETRDFVANKLGISERQVRMMTWSEVVHRIVLVQRHTRLCAARDLDEHDIVGRIMRKENYLIGMLNAGVLALHVPAGPLARWGLGLRRRFVLTKTLEWNLYWAVLDPMWDDDGVLVRREWLEDEAALKRRLRLLAAINLAVSPFLLLFLIIYFTMKNAERFYHSPGTLGSRRWSSLAKWRLRELNELPHYVTHRLAAGHEAAVRYLAQFPSPLITQVARFVSFVAGSFAALLLGLTLLDENLLEVPLAGRNVVWWLALTGILLTASRAFITDTPAALDPERAMAELVAHTHHLPRHWRGRAHTAEVQEAVSGLFQLKLLLFLEELASVLVTPFILGCSLPKCAGAILEFVRDHTERIEGVGDVCSLAAFDFGRHGNPKYGAPCSAPEKRVRSKQGKMEKSFLTFVATYPTWAPPTAGRQMLAALSQHTDAAAMAGTVAGLAGAGGVPTTVLEGGPGTSRWSLAPQPPQPPHGAASNLAAHHHQQQQQYHHQQQQQQNGGVLRAAGAQQQKNDPAVAPTTAAALAPRQLGSAGNHPGGTSHSPMDGLGPLGPLGPAASPGQSPAPPGASRVDDSRGSWQLTPGVDGTRAAAAGGRLPPPVSTDQWAAAAAGPRQQQHQQPDGSSSQWTQPYLQPNVSMLPSAMAAAGAPQIMLQRQQQQQPAHHVLQVWPSTLYPGGPSAAAMLPHNMGYSGGTPVGALPPQGVLGGGDGTWSSLGNWGAVTSGVGVGGIAGCRLDGSGGGNVSDLLPVNETQDLGSRLAASHLLLQSFYESRDATVQHRQANRAHARSMMLQRALAGGALSVAPFLAASASAVMPVHSRGSNLQGPQPSATPHSPLARTALY